MSYQAITDIIVAQNSSDFKLSATVKDSPKQSSVSFADFLASYNSAETAKEDSVGSEPLQAQDKSAVNDVKNEESVSESKVEKGKESDAAEIAEEKVTPEEKTDDKRVSDAESGKIKEKNPKTELKKDALESEKSVKADKADKKEVKDEKKLSKKDFSRLEELTEKTEFAEQAAENAEKLAGANQNNNDLQLKPDTEDSQDSDTDASYLLIKGDGGAAAQENLQISSENTAEDFEFDFSGNNQNEKKEFALDKEGKITVEDLRTEVDIADSSDKKSALRTSDIQLTNDNTAVMAVELNPNAQADVLSLNTQAAAADGSNFQAMLSNQLHNVAPEFVKAGNLVLKDNNQGTINLVLHPDDLGNVKIHLSLDGKTLSGHITVATKEALQVFKDNAETLREAFIKNGFDAASFDVSMNNGGSFNQNSGFEGQNDGRNQFARRLYGNAEGLSAELETIFENAEDISNYSVNIVA